MIGVPGLHPGAHALLQVGDDLVGDAAIDVLPIASSCRRCVGLLAAGAPPLLGLLDMNTHGSGSLPGRAGESLSLASETRRDRTRDPLALAEWRRRLTDRDCGNAGRAPYSPRSSRQAWETGVGGPPGSAPAERKRVVEGKRGSVRVDHGGSRYIKKKKKKRYRK